MKIALDAKPLFSRRTGIGRYIHQMLKELTRLDTDNEYFLCGVLGAMHKGRISGDVFQKLGQRFKIPFPFRKIVRIATELYIPRGMRKVGARLFWGTNYFGVFGRDFKTVINIHDMAHARYPQHAHPVMGKHLTGKLRDHAHKAHGILTGSHHAKKEIVELLNVPEEKIRVVYHGVEDCFRPVTDTKVLHNIRKKYSLPEKFLLFVGMIEPRKNIVGLLEAFAGLCKDARFEHGLAIVGPKGWGFQEIFQKVRDLGLARRVVFTGYAPEEDLPALYNLADVFVCPSFYEGFGFPILEAMACGTPVIASAVSSLPEIGGDAPLYMDPQNTDEIVRSIKRVLEEDGLRNDMRQRGLARAQKFSWEAAARQTIQLWEEASKGLPEASISPNASWRAS